MNRSASSFSRDPRASTVHLPPGAWATVLDGLCAQFGAIDRTQWVDRIGRGRVLDGQGVAISPQTPYRAGMRIHYYREVADEPVIPFTETVLHLDEHLVVADKPHFLPVTPAGGSDSGKKATVSATDRRRAMDHAWRRPGAGS